MNTIHTVNAAAETVREILGQITVSKRSRRVNWHPQRTRERAKKWQPQVHSRIFAYSVLQ